MWVKNAIALPKPDYQYYLNTGKKFDYNGFVKATFQITPFLTAFGDLQYHGIHYTIKGTDDKAGDVDITKTGISSIPKRDFPIATTAMELLHPFRPLIASLIVTFHGSRQR